jgi:hypothetical protein
VTEKVGVGVITPHEIVIDLGSHSGSLDVSATRFEFAQRLASNPEVFTVASGENWPYIDASGRFLRIYVFGQHDLGSDQTQQLVNQLRNDYIPYSGFPAGTKIYLGGAPAQGVDLLDAIKSSLPLIVSLTFFLFLSSFVSLFFRHFY